MGAVGGRHRGLVRGRGGRDGLHGEREHTGAAGDGTRGDDAADDRRRAPRLSRQVGALLHHDRAALVALPVEEGRRRRARRPLRADGPRRAERADLPPGHRLGLRPHGARDHLSHHLVPLPPRKIPARAVA